jgi:hypothetical protein
LTVFDAVDELIHGIAKGDDGFTAIVDKWNYDKYSTLSESIAKETLPVCPTLTIPANIQYFVEHINEAIEGTTTISNTNSVNEPCEDDRTAHTDNFLDEATKQRENLIHEHMEIKNLIKLDIKQKMCALNRIFLLRITENLIPCTLPIHLIFRIVDSVTHNKNHSKWKRLDIVHTTIDSFLKPIMSSSELVNEWYALGGNEEQLKHLIMIYAPPSKAGILRNRQ